MTMTATTDQQTQQLLESLTAETLPCQWQGCAESFNNAESLYSHLTETHIGRKSTGNLNLQCRWGACNVATVKRDHITSHVRVHVPLKPHTCNICSKSFKRPQDLKKHVKTHADDSVIVPSPMAGDRRGPGGPGGYDHNGVYPGHSGPDPTATNYSYAPNGHSADAYHTHPGGAPNGTYYAHHAPPQYGSVYYPVSHGHPGPAVFGDARRRAYDDINDFFGDVKHHRVAPVYSQEITQRLAGLHHILPVIQNSHATTIDYQAPATHHHYQLPQLASLRTKSELLDGENFLNALSSTLLESPNAAAAAGVHHPGVHYAPAHLNFRSSQSPPHHPIHSPPHRLSPGAHPMSASMGGAPLMAHTPSNSSHGTAVLTPPPGPHAIMEAVTTGAGYPNLSVMASGDVHHGYAATAGGAPISTIGSAFDRNHGHRIAGTLLQSARRSSEEAVSLAAVASAAVQRDDGSSSRLSSPGASDIAEGLRSVALSSDEKRSSDDGAAEWLEAIRVVEALKDFITKRLEREEYDSDSDKSEKDVDDVEGSDKDSSSDLEQDRVNLYPVLKPVEDEE